MVLFERFELEEFELSSFGKILKANILPSLRSSELKRIF